MLPAARLTAEQHDARICHTTTLARFCEGPITILIQSPITGAERLALHRPQVLFVSTMATPAELLAKHHPKPLTDSQDADLARILAEAREYYAKRV